MTSTEKRPFIIALVGVVGSGKTHVARILAKRLQAVRITTDDIRVGLRKRRTSYHQAPNITARRAERLLRNGTSVILDFDAVNPARRRELRRRAGRLGARIYIISIKTPERLILARLRRKRYTPGDLFENAAEAIRVYFMRKKFRKKFPRFTPNLTIDNSRPLEPQIARIVNTVAGL